MSKNYWNYCISEKTIADTIDIATFLSMQYNCLGYYCDVSIVRCIVTSLLPGTVLQWCRLFMRCRNLPAGHCVILVQAD